MKNYITPGSDNIMNDILKDPRFKNMLTINSFFKVPDGERPAGNDWYDEDGNITYDEKKVVTKKPHMMWYDENDLPTSSPHSRIPEKDKPLVVPLTRDAKTKEDFEAIYQRELKISNTTDGTAFKQWLTKKVNDMLEVEQNLPTNESVHTLKAQDLCIEFLEWLKKKNGEDVKDRELLTFNFPPIPDGILKPVGSAKLLEVEKSLKEAKVFIDETGRWIGTLQDLADLIWAFKVKNYFCSNSNKFTKEEKVFFKTRYKNQKQVEQYLYPSKRVEFNKNQFNHYFT